MVNAWVKESSASWLCQFLLMLGYLLLQGLALCMRCGELHQAHRGQNHGKEPPGRARVMETAHLQCPILFTWLRWLG
jgi:hypothetical protein